MTTSAEAAIELHVQRLMHGYGLDEAAARDAVAAYRVGDREAPHHFAAHRAALEVLADLQQQNVEVLIAALRRAAQHWADSVLPALLATFRRAAAAAQQPGDAFELVPPRELPPPGRPRPRRARDRPGWQSPYGPPARRSPRKR
ncbi:hypothetical protein DMA15_12565 [Streptomyces sp. WAC 01529]|uniref:hypothetical protein n=1 Tax=Streptomyces sp. WAC 01529 TaxID=2203205 RepID=UPI000F707639|nr:hypothetical protein [Streptomyces sp. WAC 01529]AZM53316.1 hypothetical protein DMA15_12565 [Streptomyces sp. WAC 01529]